MADTVYEYPNEKPNRGYIGFTRFWQKGEDWIQITLISEDEKDAEVHTYASLPYTEFQKAFEAAKYNVEETDAAWWHKIVKNQEMEEMDVTNDAEYEYASNSTIPWCTFCKQLKTADHNEQKCRMKQNQERKET